MAQSPAAIATNAAVYGAASVIPDMMSQMMSAAAAMCRVAAPLIPQMGAAFQTAGEFLRERPRPEWKIDGAVPRQAFGTPFYKITHFETKQEGERPKLLIVPPMSGHYATLLRGTVAAMLPNHDVSIMEWENARNMPADAGRFGLDEYIDFVIEAMDRTRPSAVMAVCQPAVPVLAACAVMAERGHDAQPDSLILMAGPIDTRINPTEVNRFATSNPMAFFEERLIHQVSLQYPGRGRPVYPGFMQLAGFMGMNFENHRDKWGEHYQNLVKGDGDSAHKHREFYDEYLAVMDMPAEFYLGTVDRVFKKHDLPQGRFTHHGRLVRPELITRTALLTVEGGNDDICGIGQTEAAHGLCKNIPRARKKHILQPGIGHYGVFNGSTFRRQIAPQITGFATAHAKAPRIKAPLSKAELIPA